MSSKTTKILAPIKQRLLQYLEKQGIGRPEFSKKTGISANSIRNPGTYSEFGGDALAKILECYEELSADWLLLGIEPMKKTLNYKPVEANTLAEPRAVYTADAIPGSTPLYDIYATAGAVVLFDNFSGVGVQGHIHIPDIPPCDGAVTITGDSMYPILKSGDIVLYKVKNDKAMGWVWGEMYLISLLLDHDPMVLVKYVQKSEQSGYIKLVSHNKHHSDMDVPLDTIQSFALIKASIRKNTL